MGVSLFLAKFLGVYLILVSTLMLTRREVMRKGFQEILYIPGLLMLSGLISLLGGVAIVIGNSFLLEGSIVVTILGFLMVVKGLIRLGWPNICRDWGNAFLRDDKSWLWISIFSLVLGLFLVAQGCMSEMNHGFFG